MEDRHHPLEDRTPSKSTPSTSSHFSIDFLLQEGERKGGLNEEGDTSGSGWEERGTEPLEGATEEKCTEQSDEEQPSTADHSATSAVTPGMYITCLRIPPKIVVCI